MAGLRARLQWPRRVVATVDVAALLLAAAAVWASFAAMEAETDTPFLAAQALVTAAVPMLALAAALALARIDRTPLDVAAAIVAPLLLAATVLAAWAMCWAAGVGGERCWWEHLDP